MDIVNEFVRRGEDESMKPCPQKIMDEGYALINLHSDISAQLTERLCKNINRDISDGQVDWNAQAGCHILLYIGNYNSIKQAFIKWLPWLNKEFNNELLLNDHFVNVVGWTPETRRAFFDKYIRYTFSETDIAPEGYISIGQGLRRYYHEHGHHY